jgi:predicted transglutaminase-like cysteine proteinase
MKRFAYKGLGSILAGLLLCGCASTARLDLTTAPSGNVKRFAVLQSAAPPAGAMQFCAVDPELCGPQAAAFFQGQPGAANAIAVGGIDGAGAQADGRAESFRYMLAARRKNAALLEQARAEGIIFVSAAKSVHVTLTDEMWLQLRDVQKLVNQKLKPATDQAIYGKEEVWALPLQSWTLKGPPKGDCEDFALEKRKNLMDLGWPPEALSIVVVDAPKIGAHAVLVVSTDRGEFVLDNLQYEPVLAETLPYQWLSRQSGLDLLAWTQTSLVEQAIPAAAPSTAPSTAPSSAPAENATQQTLFASLLQERIKRARASREADALLAASIAVRPPVSDEGQTRRDFAIELGDWNVGEGFDDALGELIAAADAASTLSEDGALVQSEITAPALTAHQHPEASPLMESTLSV